MNQKKGGQEFILAAYLRISLWSLTRPYWAWTRYELPAPLGATLNNGGLAPGTAVRWLIGSLAFVDWSSVPDR